MSIRDAHRILFRILLGTSVYIAILTLAAPHPNAAGLMLTFPALNGLGFLYAERSSIPDMARSMLFMPVVNGGLCAAYIYAFLYLERLAPGPWLGWLLLGPTVLAWRLIVTTRTIRNGVPDSRRIPYAAAAVVVGALAVWIADASNSGFPAHQPAHPDGFLQSALQTIATNWFKIVLFVVGVVALLYFSERVSDSFRGVLAGLPLVPFGGLLSIAIMPPPDRAPIFRGMGIGIWLGPAIAILFVLAISTYFSRRAPLRSPLGDFLVRFAAVVGGWSACGALVGAIVRILELTK